MPLPRPGSKASRAEHAPCHSPHPPHLPPPPPSPPRCRLSPTPPSPRPRLREGRRLLRSEQRRLFSSSSWRSFLSPEEEREDGERQSPQGVIGEQRALVLPKASRGMLTLPGPPALGQPCEHQALGQDSPVESLAAWSPGQKLLTAVQWPAWLHMELQPQPAASVQGRMAQIHGQGTIMQRSPVRGWQEPGGSHVCS